jgi:cytochrome c-type biogenesis protein
MGLGSAALGFLAGILSTLSPCVLPLLPLVLGAAVAAHRFGAVMLAAGLVVSFVAISLFVATIGFSIGLDEELLRRLSAILLAVFGLLLLSETLQRRLSVATASVGNAGNRLMARLSPTGLAGQFALGLILGVAWSPCVGPTLGAASMLAANGQDLGQVALVLGAFACGAAVPLLVVGSISRKALAHWRGSIQQVGKTGRCLLGGAMVTLAVLILSGQERALETQLVNASPDWLINATTRF